MTTYNIHIIILSLWVPMAPRGQHGTAPVRVPRPFPDAVEDCVAAENCAAFCRCRDFEEHPSKG